jgi:hypothetical protein
MVNFLQISVFKVLFKIVFVVSNNCRIVGDEVWSVLLRHKVIQVFD